MSDASSSSAILVAFHWSYPKYAIGAIRVSFDLCSSCRGERDVSSSLKVEIEREVRMSPSCVVVVGGGTEVEHLKRVASLGSGLKAVEFDPIFVGKL